MDDPCYMDDGRTRDPRDWREGLAFGLVIGGAYLAGAATVITAATIAGWWR